MLVGLPCLMGQVDPLPTYAERFRDGFQQGGGVDVPSQLMTLLVILLVVGALLGAAAFWRSRQQGRPVDCPRRLFAELCARHELDWPSRRLLKHLSRAYDLEHPARLFVEPQLFEAARLPESLHAFQPQLAALRTRLF
jgi:hypothetical protein